jgi:DNA polymerase-3 subunit gamma/tau
MADSHTTDGGTHSSRSDYVVIARRYRPQSFAELIGQEHVAKGLAAAIAASRVGHAYLFTGARGTGKTSSARILAKCLNCEHGPTPSPCNECDICVSITAGSDMDVLEIDGASNRGIDEIRQLRQNVNVRPSRSRFKIYIIDEVHMLTKEAFNALLKTLEEPPEHVKFIFCTTEPEKIPITILSRCQRFDFAGIQTPQIIERLKFIADTEGVKAEPEALEILARRAAGSMRDSQSLLEQLLAFGGKKITVADVHNLLGTAGAERIRQLVTHLIERNAAAALADLDGALTQGVDIGQLMDQLLGYFRDLMAVAVGCPADALLHVSASERANAQEAATRIGLQTIMAAMQIIDQTLSRLKYLSYPRIVAELALVRLCCLEDLDSLPELISQLQTGGPILPLAPTQPAVAPAKKKFEVNESAGVPNGSPTTSHTGYSNGAAANGSGTNGAAAHSNGANANAASSDDVADDDPQPTPRGERPETEAQLAQYSDEAALALWHQAAEELGGLAGDAAKTAANAAIRAPNSLVVFFPAKYNFGRERCESPENAKRLVEILSRLAGGFVRLSFQTVENEPEAAAARPVSHRQYAQTVCERPYVKNILDKFDARDVRVDAPRN